MDDQFELAVRAFYEVREQQRARQAAQGREDAGSRGAVTGGAHLNALTTLVVDHLTEVLNFPRSSIYLGKKAALPGYFRPAKEWDIVVKDGDKVVAAVEFKSHVGSFGNNFNNRSEEAIGSAADTRRAIEEGLWGSSQPWLGYVLLLQDAPGSTKPAHRNFKTLFEVDSEFGGRPSYAERYRLLCQRLVNDELYHAACFILAPEEVERPISQPDDALTFSKFIESLTGHVKRERGL
ncbi:MULTISPECIES: PaeR7I family type II restriction endonuclease [Streptomyces]|uniref:PaeR7I family type II restriction endonuclease n=1 Tax=Streptomyces TaxID=1883 RepID=UPI001AE61E8F|nr:PaeR7I family type II restriction endonuclease [Streptomyces sp. KCTC 0041BP]MBP0937227.1 type II site-specific deoxyribonuclease [Streptomyces sp. KCTC 0041BP]